MQLQAQLLQEGKRADVMTSTTIQRKKMIRLGLQPEGSRGLMKSCGFKRSQSRREQKGGQQTIQTKQTNRVLGCLVPRRSGCTHQVLGVVEWRM